jgi:hypothetical protein
LTLLFVAGIVVGCLFVILMSFWLTAKLGGSTTWVVWGMFLGVTVGRILLWRLLFVFGWYE